MNYDYRDEYYKSQAKLASLSIYNESLKDAIKELERELRLSKSELELTKKIVRK